MKLFNNTKITYADKTDSDLTRAYLLFKIISKPYFGKFLTKFLEFAIRIKLPIQRIVKLTIYKQFCGGTSIKESELTINKLWESGIGTILNYSVEGKKDLEEFNRTKCEIISTIKKASYSKNIPFAVFKPTAISSFSLLEKITNKSVLNKTELKEKIETEARIEEICKNAVDLKVPIFIDAEESWIQGAIDDIVRNMMLKFNKQEAWIFNTLQLYRNDRIKYLENIIDDAKYNNYFLGLKLVRGAYHKQEIERSDILNYDCPVHRKKADTDQDFNTAQRICIENINLISFCSATHNEESTSYLIDLLNNYNIKRDDKRIIFSQLLGMSDNISYNLSHMGYYVAKYVPYGPVKDVIPYLIRRAEENTSIAGQMNNELVNLIKERRRRKRS